MKIYRSFYRQQQGATIIEFALVAPVFFILIMGIIEFGMILFHQVVVESVTIQASRLASLNVATPGCDRVCTVRRLVEEKAGGLLRTDRIAISANRVSGSASPRVPEYCLTTPPSYPAADGSCPPSVPCDDVNNNNRCDGPANMSLGDAGDLIEIRVSYPHELITPGLSALMGRNGVWMSTTATVVKNEPF
jgi:hypothetical protein